MRKIFLFSSLAALVFTSAGFAANRAIAANADGEDNGLAALLRGYIEGGKYTKKTGIYLTDDAVEANKNFFHANTTKMYRTTYYDETAGVDGGGALLMGDYDGGFDEIRSSGYINGADGTHHFSYKGEASPKIDELFTNIKDDGCWHLGQTLSESYETLSALADFANENTIGDSADWKQSGSAYIHTVPADGLVANEQQYYTDEILHRFQYFAAPMLLQQISSNHFISPTRVVIQPATSFLSIRIFTSASDETKLLYTGLTDAGDMLLAEARIYGGLSFDPGPHYVLEGAYGEESWSTQAHFDYSPDTNVPEQYKATNHILAENFTFKVNEGENWYGIQHLDGNSWKYVRNEDETADGNIVLAAHGSAFEFYWIPSYGEQLFIVPTDKTLRDVTINITFSEAPLADPQIIYDLNRSVSNAWINGAGLNWYKLTWVSENTYTYVIEGVESGTNLRFQFVTWSGSNRTMSYDYTWRPYMMCVGAESSTFNCSATQFPADDSSTTLFTVVAS